MYHDAQIHEHQVHKQPHCLTSLKYYTFKAEIHHPKENLISILNAGTKFEFKGF